MSQFRFEVATANDDAELRHVLAATPMPGLISVSYRREPSYFGASVVSGGFHQVLAVRDAEANRIAGFVFRSVRTMFVNGRPEPVGYLSGLRTCPSIAIAVFWREALFTCVDCMRMGEQRSIS